jgi:carbonic anhydrase
VVGALLGGGGVLATHRESPPPQRDDSVELTAKQARERLEAGNARYLAGTPQYPDQGLRRRRELTEEQHPFAAVLSCADSLLDPDSLFDPDSLLLVVLGHSRCGAVTATIETLKGGKPTGTAIDSLVAGITPAVKEASVPPQAGARSRCSARSTASRVARSSGSDRRVDLTGERI